jgi:hypothetical protein
MVDLIAPLRKYMVAGMNGMVRDRTEDEAYAELVDQYGAENVWNTLGLTRDFEVIQFAAPFVVVVRKSDSVRGSLAFTHAPRYYYDFKPDKG